jgi:enolase-phosphatase E1
MSLLENVRCVLLDIEGTTTSIDFVHDVLFSYARTQARSYLTANFDADDVRADVALLCEEHAADVHSKLDPPAFEAKDSESVATYVEWLITLDRKSTGLKSLQGKIWREGYLSGALKAQVFADVAPAIQRWHEEGLRIAIFSSGSVLAQQLLFAHTEAGDLTRFIDEYFDTKIGKKGDEESYRRIAEALNLAPRDILFISDVVAELDAANAAGVRPLLSVRPGNTPQRNADRFRSITRFDEI